MESFLREYEFLQTFIDAVPSLLFIVDRDVRVLHYNHAASMFIGGNKEVVLRSRGGDMLRCIHSFEAGGCGKSPDCSDCVIRNSVSRAFKNQPVIGEPVAMKLDRDGRVFDVYFSLTTNLFSYKGKKFVLLILNDVTRQKLTEEALIASDKRLRTIMSVMGEGILVMDEYGALSFMNQEAERLLGWRISELAGRQVHEIIHYQKADGSPNPKEDCPIMKSISAGIPFYAEEDVLIRKDGVPLPVTFACNPIKDNNCVVGSVAAFHDISKIKEAYESVSRVNKLLEHQATTDPLTGIYNRLKFDEMLMNEINRAKRHNIPLSLVMFDIDHFKAINDTCGHHIGDTVLQQLTAHVSKKVRKHDCFARWGGEEFMLLLTHNNLAAAASFAEKLRKEIEELRIRGLQRVTCSFGVAQLRENDDLFSFTKRTDDALYKAKSHGRNSVVTLDAEDRKGGKS